MQREIREVAEAGALLHRGLAVRGVFALAARGRVGVAHETVGEGVAEQRLRGVGKVITGCGEVLQDWRQCTEIGDRVGLRISDHACRHIAQSRKCLQQIDQLVSLIVYHAKRGRQVVEGASDRRLLIVSSDGESVDLLKGGEQRRLVVIELSNERGGGGDELLDFRLIAAECLVEFANDGVGLVEPTAVEQQRGRAEDFLDLRIATRPVERNHVAVAQSTGRTACRRRERDEFFAQQAGLPDRRLGIVGEFGVPVDPERDERSPAVEFDVGDFADRNIVDPHAALRHQVENVPELHLDRVGVAAETRATG